MSKEEKKDKKPSYGAKDIFVLEGLEPVRKRPGMYIGTTGPEGLHHLIWEVVDNCIDEAMAGFAKHITVEFLKDNKVSIADDGRGIPVDIHPQTKKSALETAATVLHAGGKFGGDSYKVSSGLHGVGLSVVNALSTTMRAEVRRDGGLYMQEYKIGKPQAPVKKIAKAEGQGTKITFQPDPTIFQTIQFDFKKVVDHLRQQAYLTKGLRIDLTDDRGEEPLYHSFYFEGGVSSFLHHFVGNGKIIQGEQFYVEKEVDGINVEATFTYIDDNEAKEISFANHVYTSDGGTHLTGFRTALTRTLNDYAKKEGYVKDDGFTGDDVREGLVSIVSVKVREPQFEGQTKARLGTTEARPAVDTAVSEALKEFLDQHPQDARKIIEKNILAAKARKAAKAAKDTVLRKGALEGLTLPGKLADCSSRRAEESELFLVEGDSAGGSAKSGRDRRTQAILPLRGKILNVEKSRIDKMLANKEIRSLVIALGTAISDSFDLTKLRYHKIILMTDADVDGAHIRTLLLTLFYRYFPKIVEGGYLYVAQPPLYRIQAGKQVRYVYSDSEKDKVISELQKQKIELKKQKTEDKNIEESASEEPAEGAENPVESHIKGVSIQRYKGLGEMNPDQLWETTMDPKNRLLRRVGVMDAVEADNLFDILMGEVVEPRRNFIQAHATSVRNLDI